MNRSSIAFTLAAVLHLGIATSYFISGAAQAMHNHASDQASSPDEAKKHQTCNDKKACAACADQKIKKECADKKTCPLNAKTKTGDAKSSKHAECPHHTAPKAGL